MSVVKTDDLRFHPAADLLPMLTEAELRDLTEDVKLHGLRVPIMLFGGQILDGRNRYLACRRAGIEPRFEEYEGESSPVDVVLSLNLHRRHLSEYQRRKLVAEVLRLRPDATNREIARTTKVDHKTVASVKAKVEAGEDVGYRKKPEPPKKPVEAPAGAGDAWEPPPEDDGAADEPISTAPSDDLLDAMGSAVPNNLRDVFGDPWLREAHHRLIDIERFAKRLAAAVKGKCEHYKYLKAGDLMERLTSIQEEASASAADCRNGAAWALCPKCKIGDGCRACRGQGHVPEWRAKELAKGAA